MQGGSSGDGRLVSDNWRDFESLVREHQSMVFSIALRITGDRGSAEDVAQEAFLNLYQHLSEIASPVHAVAWLRKAAAHRAIDACRRLSRFPKDGFQYMDLAEETAAGDTLLRRHLHQQIQRLPRQMRAVIVLRYQQDLTPAEIAQTLDMPVATVKSNLQRGLKLLRRETESTLGEHHG